MTKLRDYQEQGVTDILQSCTRRLIFTLPTGTGKTEVGSAVVLHDYRNGRRCLWLAHRRELVNQAVERLKRAGIPGHDIGVIMADDERANPRARVQVASIGTVIRRLAEEGAPEADRVILDEAHHAAAKMLSVLLAHYVRADITGLTATPFRTGPLQLGQHFEDLIYGPKPSQLIAAGWMMKPRVFAPPDDELPTLSEVRRNSEGDFNLKELSRAVNRRHLVGSIVAHWKRIANNRRTVVFAVDIEHARSIAHEFIAAGIAAEVLIGTTPKEDRDLMFARLKVGVTRILVSVGVLTEGWDAPWVKCAIVARPTCSLNLHIQMAGRILRPWGEDEPIILDHAGNTNYFDVPHADREMSLTMTAPRRGRGPGEAVDRNPETGELTTREGQLREVRSVPVQTHCAAPDCKALLSTHPRAMRRRRGKTDAMCQACATARGVAARPAEARVESIQRGHMTRAQQQSADVLVAQNPTTNGGERQELLAAGWKAGLVNGEERWHPPGRELASWVLFKTARKYFLTNKKTKQRSRQKEACR